MYRIIDSHLWLYRLLHWLLFGMYSFIVYMLTAIIVTWPIRPITAMDQLPWWSFVIALLLIALTHRPVHNYLGSSMHHLVYGQHDDPYAMVERVQRHLHYGPSPDALLPTLAATLADTLKLPYVAIQAEPDDSHQSHTSLHTTAMYGTPPDGAKLISIPLRYRNLTLGVLSVSPRRPRERLSSADLHLLDDLARYVGITLHAARLSDALQTSRAQLVTAREEERRRIRRDLHDGLGPTLAALRLQLSAVRHTVRDNPAKAERMLDELRGDVRAATSEIRRLVYDLRPPMLDEFGLVGALRNLELTSDGLTRSVEAPELLPPLPAALEVALYRIAAEALHNVVRHAHATHCTIGITVHATSVALSVMDNGCGLPVTYVAGVGHHSMQERAAELGGSVSILSTPTSGLSVTAIFPLKGAHDE